MHLVPDPVQRKSMLGGMFAWNTDFCLLYTDIAGSGLLPVEAETQGKIVVTTELGGGKAIPAGVHRIAQEGLRNVLTHFGVLQGEEQPREILGKPLAVLLQALNEKDYLLAPESGVFEVPVDLGARVYPGQPVGQIHFLERPDRSPEVILSQTDGFLLAFRAPCLTQQGDCVTVIAEPVDPEALA